MAILYFPAWIIIFIIQKFNLNTKKSCFFLYIYIYIYIYGKEYNIISNVYLNLSFVETFFKQKNSLFKYM
jgi:hypothetical protein